VVVNAEDRLRDSRRGVSHHTDEVGVETFRTGWREDSAHGLYFVNEDHVVRNCRARWEWSGMAPIIPAAPAGGPAVFLPVPVADAGQANLGSASGLEIIDWD